MSDNGNGPRARWEDALDTQIRLLDLARHRQLPMVTTEGTHALPDRYADLMATLLMRADPVFVAPDVFAAWTFARDAFDPEPLRPEEPFASTGLVLFPEPFTFAMTSIPIDAVLWAVDEPLLRVFQFAQRTEGWRTVGVGHFPFGDEPSAVVKEAGRQPGWKDHEGDKLLTAWAGLQAFWRMARGFVRASERVSRPGRRAAKRAKLEHSGVTVIRLRRQRHELSETERDVDWSCRWMVRGHWRHLADGRQTWVMPYVKGPDDKPFRVTDRVWEFVR